MSRCCAGGLERFRSEQREMDRTTRFWDRIAERYARQPIADEAAYQKKLEKTREYLRPDSLVLEFGCGTGSTSILHAPLVAHIEAVDISPKMLEIARAKAESAEVANVTWTRSSIEAFDPGERHFDVVLGLSILHLVQDREAVMRKVHNMLVPGGIFVTSTACIGGRWRFLELILPIGRLLGVLPMVQFFTPAELEASFQAADFELEHRWQPAKDKAVFIGARRRS